MAKIKDSIQATSNKPKEKYQVKNWSTYNNALVSRGSITLWLSEEVISSWYYQGARQPGGAVKYAEACMICLLSIKSLFRLGFRQTQGFGSSLIERIDWGIVVPSYSQICRRQASLSVPIRVRDVAGGSQGLHIVVDSTGLKVYGEGEWKTRMHGISKRRTFGIEEKRSAEWKKQSGYHRRSKAEVAMFRYKTIFGPKTYARKMTNQKTEVRIKCACINKFNLLGMPISVRVA